MAPEKRYEEIEGEELYRRLATVPDSVLPALAKRIGPEGSRSVVPAALAAFGGKELSPEIAAVLSQSSVPVVAALGRRHSKQ